MADSSHNKGEKWREKVYVSIEKCERELNALMYMKGLSTSVEV